MIFFVHGTDSYRCRQKSKELQDQFSQKKDKAGFNIVKLEGEKLDFDKFKQEVLTTPFLGEKKFIVVNNVTKNRTINKDLLEFLKTRDAELENSLMFVEIYESKKEEPANALYKFLKTQKYAWEIDLLTNYELENWLKDYFKNKKTDIDPRIISQLIALVGNDLSQLTNEANKLISYKNGGQITSDDVKLLVSAKFEDNIFNLTDAIAYKNSKLALKLLSDQLKSGSAPLAIQAMIARQFKIILKVKSKLEETSGYPNQAQIATEIGEHPFVIKKAIEQARGFSIQELIKINQTLLDIESKLKNGAKNPELLFDLLVLNK
ncbi:MAG: DNA polymerase III subunit delta [Candidatus Buchananbacteria bacterium]